MTIDDSPVLRALTSPEAAYIHVPFCVHRCGYCDFTLVAGRDDLIEAYLDALEIELSLLETPRNVHTLFVGGGTPTHLPPRALGQLMQIIRRWFHLAADGEFSVEANPAGLDDARVDVLADAGVNRVSLGAQAFDADVLRTLERDHTPDEIGAAVSCVRRRIDNVSIDLIFGVPGQRLETWRDTLRAAVALDPRHVSTYGLTYEKGAQFWSRREKGELVPVAEESERSMYAAAMDDLADAGIQQYELSNFARPEFRCRHNEVYWSGGTYYAAGPGAARHIDGRRETNHRSTTTWLKRVLAGESPVGETETLSREERAREVLVLGLRRNDGVASSDFRRDTGFDVEDLAGDAIRKHVDNGLLERTQTAIRLTREGRFVADTVVVDML